MGEGEKKDEEEEEGDHEVFLKMVAAAAAAPSAHLAPAAFSSWLFSTHPHSAPSPILVKLLLLLNFIPLGVVLLLSCFVLPILLPYTNWSR